MEPSVWLQAPWARVFVAVFVLVVIASWWPARRGAPPEGAGERPFRWDADASWRALESEFVERRRAGASSCKADEAVARFDAYERAIGAADGGFSPTDALAEDLERTQIRAGVTAAACPEFVARFLETRGRARAVIKAASRSWSADPAAARDRAYRLLQGGRMVEEQVLVQHARAEVDLRTWAQPGRGPSAEIHGVRIHSGDILVSRGGAATSSLIARGNDYPGSFSHIAVVHIAHEDGPVSIVEAHIERGVAVSKVEDYLRDTKLRIMVLRLRADHPGWSKDPELAHHAAEAALTEVRSGHVAYDFTMNTRDGDRKFCSEVASAAYAQQGVDLWQPATTMSARGVVRWLADFGVEHFRTHGPSDLEYDPQLVVVAEWRDPETLTRDLMDTAVSDALLEAAEGDHELEYAWYLLGPARWLKLYSWLLNRAGMVGPVPEGMSADAALRVKSLERQHAGLVASVAMASTKFEAENGYRAPYWQLVEFAREAIQAAPE